MSKKVSKKTKKIVLGMSGGVDSSVCALILKNQGYEVIGLFMQNWDSFLNNDIKGNIQKEQMKCDPQKDFEDAKKVADYLNIKIYRIDFIKKYWEKVFLKTLDSYKKGHVPNPDVLCNRHIKFDQFIQYAEKKFATNQIAMGHYAKVEHLVNHSLLKIPKDVEKDQTYFLCYLNQNQLKNVTFPLSDLTKKEVREIAKNNNLPTWSKKDSTGICFIGERKFKDFLNNYLEFKKGPIIDIQTNKIIGTHDGVIFYTEGQNKNLNLGGQENKYFVCKKDLKNNILYVVNENNKQKYLTSVMAIVQNFHWIYQEPTNQKKLKVRFRHRGELIDCHYEHLDSKNIKLSYKPTMSVTIGQYAVLYQDNICLGGGIIDKIIE